VFSPRVFATTILLLGCLSSVPSADAGLPSSLLSASPGESALGSAWSEQTLRGSASGAALCRAPHTAHRHAVHCRERAAAKHPRRRRVAQRPSAPSTVTTLQAASANEAKVIQVAEIEQLSGTQCENTKLLPSAENLTLVREATLCLINEERADHQERALAPNAALEQAAEAHSLDMVTSDYFSHTSPSGLRPAERVLAAGYLANPLAGYTIGENIAWATSNLATPEAVVAAWVNSPDHLENILDATYQDTGIGIWPAAPGAFARGRPGATYTQDFAAIEN